MKIINISILIIILSLIALSVKAQLVINTAEKYLAGESYIYWNADAAQFNSGTGGENVVWDFSSLQKLQTEDSGQVLLPSQTQYASLFPKATEVRKSSNGSFLFLERKTDSVFLRGFRQTTPSINIQYTKPQLFAINNLRYGDSYVSSSEYTYKFGNQDFIGGGFFAMTVDGQGKLILDGKTYEDVLRVRIEQDNADTIKPFNSIVSTTKITAYRWYNKYSGLPLLSVDSVVVQSQGGTQSNIEVLGLKKSYGAVGINELDEGAFSASVYYNNINILGANNNSINLVEVYDITGKLISQSNCSNDTQIQIQLPYIATAGQIFIIKIHTRNTIETLKLGVQ